MKIEDQQAFPIDELNGMTYREWLIGQALGSREIMELPKSEADYAIKVADAVLKLLKKEADDESDHHRD